VKDLVTIEGTDPVEVYGYGLVIGLNGTGDGRSITYTQQSVRNLLERMGLTVSDDRIRAKNVASVMVTGMVTPFDRSGSLVDVTVSSIGDASSLAGGLLLLTELRGPDQVLYVTAQGAISVGGYDFAASSGSRVRRNYVTSGRVPEGGRVVASADFAVPQSGIVHLHLDEPDFSLAKRVSEAMGSYWSTPAAVTPVDAGQIAIDLDQLGSLGGFSLAMADLEEVTVEPTIAAKVVINERTGTLVAGGGIRIQPATVSHGNLNVRIEAVNAVSQPAPFSRTGETTPVRNAIVDATTGIGGVVSLPSNTTADELATALNALGVEPRDLIAIFQALKEAGSLPAKMEIL
jgi:flagellar P-ring protein precursor FlgI